MIGWMRGRVIHREPTQVILDVHGVGYRVHVPLHVTSELVPDATLELFVYTHVTEGQIALFGFPNREEQRTFEHLLKIQGVGPRLALSILSHLKPPELIRVIAGKNSRKLTSIPGIGKKTAERVLLELAAWAEHEVATGSVEGGVHPVPAPVPQERLEETIRALVVLGYKRREVESQVYRLLSQSPDLPAEELVRRVLQERGAAF